MTLKIPQDINDQVIGEIVSETSDQKLQVTTYQAILDEQIKRIKEVRDRLFQERLIRIRANREDYNR
jgi:hypothetical protein